MEEPLIALDVDGTAVRDPLFLLLMHFLAQKGYGTLETAEIMNNARRKHERRATRFHQYSAALQQVRESGFLKGVPLTAIEEFAQQQSERGRKYLFTSELLSVAQELGYRTLAVSGSPVEITRPVCEYYGIFHCLGAKLEVENGLLTGEVVFPVFDDKAQAVRDYRAGMSSPTRLAVAIGDELADLPLLTEAEYGIAFCPSPELRRAARGFSLPIVVERSESIYVLTTRGEGRLADILPLDIAALLEPRIKHCLL